ncbi:NAD(P)-dependent dehydrogenase (short-subunit alcohol dehydrogenase family) [Micromonospora sp. Llam0]|uniref:SDR family NAD(P)-dependent oxidoreductase n=1 Tax=Micromonospora sp. Llam0 TaxID=2485143 RepID=UPI000FA5020A|nr:SDR family NAD(P)-dependent oxidoreductase [Micromonospora sp. Llam0]ROO50768.1 NAD(P)-dependent dehydrogenase (short-subunit alcohol dehydrogenase family) [Micromonospora sp. Llam0]
MKTIVMTGGTSGFGADTRRRLVAQPGTRVLSGTRRAASGDPDTASDGPDTLSLDLARLDSVRAFARAVTDRLDGTPIDALVLNAGLSFRTGDRRTVDGFETTFAVNHLAHYLLIRLLMPNLAPKATVIVTTSGTHDPDHDTLLPTPPRHADARLLARPDTDPERDTDPRSAGGRAYTSSKLCNVLTVRALAARPEARSGQWRVLAFDPGPTPGTGLLRDTSPTMRLAWRILSRATRLMPRFNRREVVAAALTDLTLGAVTAPPGHYYARVVRNQLTWTAPSRLARSDDARDALWADSADLLSLP